MAKLALSVALACCLLASAAALTEEPRDNQPAVVRMSMLVPAVRIRKLLGFSWNDCGGAGAWVKIRSASVKPDPVDLKGPITMAFAYTATHAFGTAGQPLSGSVEIKKKVFGAWIKVPCVDNLGSCNYANMCQTLKPPATCPPEFVKAGMACKCPFPAGNFTMPGYSFKVDASKIPSFLESGDYQINVNVQSGSNQVLCAHAQVSLS